MIKLINLILNHVGKGISKEPEKNGWEFDSSNEETLAEDESENASHTCQVPLRVQPQRPQQDLAGCILKVSVLI